MFGWYLYIPFMVLFYYVGNKLSAGPDEMPTATAQREGSIETSLYIGLVAVVVAMGILGTSISHSLMRYGELSVINNAELQPTIFYASDTGQQTVSVDGKTYQQLTYAYSGEQLDGKPSYYENELVPLDWQVQQRDSSNQEVQLLIRHATTGKLAEIRYWYWFAGQRYASLGALKKARLKRAVFANAETKIEWMWRPCPGGCIDSRVVD